MERGATATGAREFHLLPLALAGGWAEAPAFTHALPEPFALLRGHVRAALLHATRAALLHATTEIGAPGTVQSKSAEEDPAQRQDPQRLPEGDLAPAEERRQKPIPQMQHDFAPDGDKYQKRQNRQRSNENQSLPSLTHVQSLMLS